jgi:hypothetical protein
VLLERPEIERDVVHGSRQDAAGGAAGQVGAERVVLRHAAAMLGDQLAHGNPGRGDLDAGPFHPPRDRNGAQARASVPPVACPPPWAALQDVVHPKEGLDVVDQRRPAEQPDLERRPSGLSQGG